MEVSKASLAAAGWSSYRANQALLAQVPAKTIAPAAVGKAGHAQPPYLTPRQLDVLSSLCQGLSNKMIARRLNISAATVKVHIGCILRELGVSSRLQAVISARCFGAPPSSEPAT